MELETLLAMIGLVEAFVLGYSIGKTFRREKMTDITMRGEGSLVGFTLHTLAARQWFETNVGADGWQWLGTTLWIDCRYAHMITDGIAEAGLKMEL